MRKIFLILSVLSMLLLSACGGAERGSPDDAAPVEPAGPALIMFYTDN